MNLQDLVSTIMTKNIYTLDPADKLKQAKELMDTYAIHHIPVLEEQKLVGIISKSDLLYYLKAVDNEANEKYLNEIRLKNYTVGEVMSKKAITIDADDAIEYALEIFSDNLFHAIPVMHKGKLVGMVTPYDVIHRLLSELRRRA